MKTRIILLSAVASLLMVGSAKAWDCPAGQSRYQAPAGTPTTTPYYDVVEGIAFICIPTIPPTPTTPPSSTTQTQSQQQNQSQSASATSQSNSASNSNSSASNTLKNVGNSSASLNNAGNSTNTSSNKNSLTNSGGNSTNTLANSNKLTDSGNSQNTNTTNASLTNSGGNSSNTLTATGVGGAGGTSSSSAQSAASNNGNGANNSSYSNSTKVEAAASTAFAQAAPTVSCFKGIGVGGQTLAGGLSFSGGKIDKNCARLETARSFANFGSRIAYCKVMLTDDYAKKAGISIDECLTVPQVIVTPTPAPIAAIVPPITINVPAPVIEQAPVVAPPIKSSGSLAYVGDCKLYQYNTCLAFLNQAIRSVQGRNAKIVVYGPLESGRVLTYLHSKLSAYQIDPVLSDDQNDTVTINVWSAE